MRRTRGFTILELLITVALVAVVASVALPALARSRRGASEASAIRVMRMAVTVSEVYRNRYGGYPSSESDLVDAGLLPINANGEIAAGPDGYDFEYTGKGATWSLVSYPTEPGVTGDRSFYVDQTGVIRFAWEGTAGPGSQPLD